MQKIMILLGGLLAASPLLAAQNFRGYTCAELLNYATTVSKANQVKKELISRIKSSEGFDKRLAAMDALIDLAKRTADNDESVQNLIELLMEEPEEQGRQLGLRARLLYSPFYAWDSNLFADIQEALESERNQRAIFAVSAPKQVDLTDTGKELLETLAIEMTRSPGMIVFWDHHCEQWKGEAKTDKYYFFFALDKFLREKLGPAAFLNAFYMVERLNCREETASLLRDAFGSRKLTFSPQAQASNIKGDKSFSLLTHREGGFVLVMLLWEHDISGLLPLDGLDGQVFELYDEKGAVLGKYVTEGKSFNINLNDFPNLKSPYLIYKGLRK